MWFIGILLISLSPIIYNETMEFLTNKSGYGKRGILKDVQSDKNAHMAGIKRENQFY